MIRKLLAALCVAFLGLSLLGAGELTAQGATIISHGYNDDVAFVQTKTTGGTAGGQPGVSPGTGGGSLDGMLPSLDVILAEVELLLGLLLEEVRQIVEAEARLGER
jgi:hypothetical protein